MGSAAWPFLWFFRPRMPPMRSYGGQVKVQRRGSDVKHFAKVLSVGWECDAAVFTVENDERPGNDSTWARDRPSKRVPNKAHHELYLGCTHAFLWMNNCGPLLCCKACGTSINVVIHIEKHPRTQHKQRETQRRSGSLAAAFQQLRSDVMPLVSSQSVRPKYTWSVLRNGPVPLTKHRAEHRVPGLYEQWAKACSNFECLDNSKPIGIG